ncbi:MAG TPA: hypothetical protein DDZ81_21650 [Acetobacteraceae bacterium]|jgi:hypothetical protein|nr:hypothetical protein [Acetobacteraceae bacterium]
MLKKQFKLSLLALICGLTGCVAAPLAQIAASQMSTPAAPCPAGTTCQPTGVAADISKGLGDSFHKLTSLASDSQTPPR